ncbi:MULTISPECIES: hypothetical protein [Rhizobium/Agrobacterium group]|uniref:hypothetical protein n=1 Tax=Rhizobium/Agrobacterium group TaxID=227290 RepID=UPI0003F1CDF8|nr:MULTISPECIES: hypothetical protein [Rhizobium/Agrobacterium group]AHK02727.1 hypothetical protein X971_2866 [Agrobacterium tumefaciens LBA4213 (Ach5)]
MRKNSAGSTPSRAARGVCDTGDIGNGAGFRSTAVFRKLFENKHGLFMIIISIITNGNENICI